MKILLVISFTVLSYHSGMCQFDNELQTVISVLCSSENKLVNNMDSIDSNNFYLSLNDELIKHIPDYMRFHRIISTQKDKSLTLDSCSKKNIRIIFDPFASQVYHNGIIKSLWVIVRMDPKNSKFEISLTSISEKKIKSFNYKRYLITYSKDGQDILRIQELKPKFVNVMN